MRIRLRRRQMTCEPKPLAGPDALQALDQPRVETLIEPGADQLAAWRVLIPPLRAAPLLAPAQGGSGTFLVVLSGSLTRAGLKRNQENIDGRYRTHG